MDFKRIGILQIGDKRVAVRPLHFESRLGEVSEITLEVVPGVFDMSNRVNKFARFAYGFDLAAPSIKDVIFNDPATIVIWSDGSKTVVKCQPGDTYSKETGLALCIAKKHLGNKGNFNEVFKKWIEEA